MAAVLITADPQRNRSHGRVIIMTKLYNWSVHASWVKGTLTQKHFCLWEGDASPIRLVRCCSTCSTCMALFCHIFQSHTAKNKLLLPTMSYTQYIMVFLSQNAHRAGRNKIYSNDTNILYLWLIYSIISCTIVCSWQLSRQLPKFKTRWSTCTSNIPLLMVTVLLMLINNNVITINHVTLCGSQFKVSNSLPIATVLAP